MKRALLVGIDHYDNFPNLGGCVNDVTALYPLLARNEDDSPNLDCRLAAAPTTGEAISRDHLLHMLDGLFAPGSDFALFYFSGHGIPQNGDVALATSDGTGATPGVRFSEILERIINSQVKETVVILDCCFSGGATTIAALGTRTSILPDGTTVLTASRNDQTAAEVSRRGNFSTYVEGALDGGAADVLGNVNVSNLYAYLTESFGAWDQRPVLKANIDRLHNIRSCAPRLSLPQLRKITEWFPTPDYELPLDPSYEPTEPPAHPEHEQMFAGLQKYRTCRLIDPIGEDHLYYAAMRSTGCLLTPLGKHYWHLVRAGRV